MTAESSRPRRVALAVTECSPLDKLWNALVEHLAGAHAEIVTIFVSDDRWHRAASLPFTREISRLSGSDRDFTRQRAAALHGDIAGRARQQIDRLAAETQQQISFAILSEREADEVHRLVSVECDVLIAPSILEHWPLFAELTRVHRQVLLIDVEEQEHGNEHTDTTT
jgi:hypothetical protein